jgi:phosphatidylserine/phosphatidylglycerophosphate/cardiolipin synthase-like enzyme
MKTLWDREIFEKFSQERLVNAERFVWIATANIKMTFLKYKSKFVSFPDIMAILINSGVSFRIIHSEAPSKPFRDRYERIDTKGRLSAGVEFLQCPRMHSKIFIVDGSSALVGSANLTGAGIGAKSSRNRNFEVGFLFEGQNAVEPFMNYFDFIWMGGHCRQCGHRPICPCPADS